MRNLTEAYPNEELLGICWILYGLGVNVSCNGFYHTAYAVWLAKQEPERLRLVTKWLYPDVAKSCNTTWNAVEANIRRAIVQIWRNNPAAIQKLDADGAVRRPTPTEFLAMIVARVLVDENASHS